MFFLQKYAYINIIMCNFAPECVNTNKQNIIISSKQTKTMKKLLFTLLLAAAVLPGWAIDQVDGVYQIGNADDLIAFSTLVNDGTNTANAVLTADIDMSGKTYTPIGNDSHRYGGTFDGQGHVIDHLVLNNSSYNDQGIFGVVEGATIKNLIAGQYNSIKGNNNVGGLVGITNGDNWVTIENCGNEGYVEASGTGGAAIIGICLNGSRKTKILNCYNTGKIKAKKEGAVLTGWFGGENATAEVKNFYNIGDVEGQESGKYFYRNGNDNDNITFDNVYDNHSTKYTQSSKTVNACNEAWYRWPYDLNFASTTEGNRTTVWKFVGSVNHPRPIAQAPVSKDGDYYLINSNHDLYWFATVVNAGNASYKAKQTADIDFTAYTNKPESGTDTITHSVMIGWDKDHPFSGEYDGQEYNVQVSYDRTAKNTGLFRYLNNATIKNLCTTGTIKNTASCSGGIFAGTVQEGETGSTVENCLSSVTFDRGETNGDATFGGIGAYMHGSGIIKNCAFLGTINAKKAYGNGGILGYANGGTDVKVQNCYVNATTISVADDNKNNIIVRNATPENCYYVTNGNLRTQTGATQVAAGNVSSGKLCYTLNGNQSDIKWYQTLHGTDSHPYPFDTHKQVYQVSETSYSNIPASGGKVQISNAEDLMTFSAEVNAGNEALSAELTEDIDMADVTYTPIGTDAYKYEGTFDGKGCHIKNLIITGDNQKPGLFHVCGNATIRNLIMDSTCTITSNNTSGGFGGAAFVAIANTDNSVAGTLTIENCGNEAMVNGSAPNKAAFVGFNYNNNGNMQIIISNCYNRGNISGGSDNCAFMGWNAGSSYTITNCYNTGTISDTHSDGNTWGRSSGSRTVVNSYTTKSCSSIEGLTSSYSSDKVSSGELCYLLKGTQETNAFTQAIGTDDYPIFGSATVDRGQWFSDDYIYYNVDESDNITVNELNLDDTKTVYNVPANVTAKSVTLTRTLHALTADGTQPRWNTFCSPVDIDKSNFSAAKELTGVTVNGDNYSMAFTEVAGDVLEAGKPYMVQVSEGKSSLTASNVAVAETVTPVTINGLTFTGNFTNGKAPQGSFIISNNVFYNVDSDVTLKAFRGYITTSGNNVKALDFTFDDDATGISLMEDGRSQMEDGAIYNIAGQRLNKMQKGINIVNGKKILK